MSFLSLTRAYCLTPAFIVRDAGRCHYFCDNITDVAEFCNWLMFADQLLHVAVTYSRDHGIG